MAENIVVFTLGYTCVFVNTSGAPTAVGWIIAGLNIARVIKYRVYDDVFKYQLFPGFSKRYDLPGRPGHVLLRAFLDHIPRSYLYAAFSFALMYGWLQLDNSAAFGIHSQPEGLFVDFMYFNFVTMATVGYGDISPKMPLPKLLCSCEILLSVLLLASIVTLALGRFQAIAGEEKRFDPRKG